MRGINELDGSEKKEKGRVGVGNSEGNSSSLSNCGNHGGGNKDANVSTSLLGSVAELPVGDQVPGSVEGAAGADVADKATRGGGTTRSNDSSTGDE